LKKGLKFLFAFIFVVALAGSGFWMVHRFIESKEQQNNFRVLAETVLLDKPQPASKPALNIEPSPTPSADDSMAQEQAAPKGPEVLHDIAALQEKNNDCIGWIRVPDTAINYPLMWTPEQPEKYLHLDFDDSYSDYGVPFLDARCTIDSGNLILYGHNMFDSSMFAGLHKFCDKDYAEKHRQIILEMADRAREYQVFAVCKANSMESKLYQTVSFSSLDAKTEFLESARADSLYYVEPQKSSRHFITLSTCDNWGQNRRIAVIGEEVT